MVDGERVVVELAVADEAGLAEDSSVPDATRRPSPTAAAPAATPMTVVARRTRRTAASRVVPVPAWPGGWMGGCSDTAFLLSPSCHLPLSRGHLEKRQSELCVPYESGQVRAGQDRKGRVRQGQVEQGRGPGQPHRTGRRGPGRPRAAPTRASERQCRRHRLPFGSPHRRSVKKQVPSAGKLDVAGNRNLAGGHRSCLAGSWGNFWRAALVRS